MKRAKKNGSRAVFVNSISLADCKDLQPLVLPTMKTDRDLWYAWRTMGKLDDGTTQNSVAERLE